MKRPLEEASFSFNAHLREIAAGYNQLLERCQFLERSMNENMDSMSDTFGGMETPPLESVPEVPPECQASEEAFWSQEPEGSASRHMQPHMHLVQLESGNVVSLESEKRSVVGARSVARSVEAKVSVRKCWSERSDPSAGLLTPLCDSGVHKTATLDLIDPGSSRMSRSSLRCGMAIVDPNSATRLIFECITVCVCLYDAIAVPYELAWWSNTQSVPFTVMAIATVSFWWLEMGLNFFTGYLDEGIMVLDLKLTALKYLRTWFLPDIFINVVDLAILILDVVPSTIERKTPLWKYLRIGKINRLARIMVIFNRNRLQQVIQSLSNDSSNVTLIGLGMRLIAILFLLNHVICCTWYWIGSTYYGDTGASWLDMHITSGGVEYRSAPPVFQYLTALHWAFTQMTPGSMSVVPQNSIERACNVLCLILGLFVSALIISQLSAKMVRVQTVNSAQLGQMETLGRFLVEHDVPRSLAHRIRRQVGERLSQKKMLTIADLPTLRDLPTSLKQELHGALFSRSLFSHSVLYSWYITHDNISEDICFKVAEEEARAKHDDIFMPGQEAKRVYFLQKGSMKYRREVPLSYTSSVVLGNLSGIEFPDVSVAEADWMSTVAMWCHWNYVGRLNTCERCHVVTFSMEKMMAVLKGYPLIRASSRSFASAYALLATSSEQAIQVDLDILPSRVLMAMPLDERVNFCVTVLDGFQAKGGRLRMDEYYPVRRQRLVLQAQQRLVQELEKGKCVVTLGKDHQLLRTVGLCVMDIVDSCEHVLVQIATKKIGEDAVLDIALPATKVRESESNRQAAMRLIQTELPKIEGTLNFGEVLNENDETKSKNLGIRTMYLKTTYKATLQPGRPQDCRLHVNSPVNTWTCSQSLTKSKFHGLESVVAVVTLSAQVSSSIAMILDSVTILPVRYKDKTTCYAWMQRHDFHQVKQCVPSNEELTPGILEAFAEVERMVPVPEAESLDVEIDRVEI